MLPAQPRSRNRLTRRSPVSPFENCPPRVSAGKLAQEEAALRSVQQRSNLVHIAIVFLAPVLALEQELKVGQLLGIIRVAVSGKLVAPPLFETLSILGRESTLERVDQGIEALASLSG